MSYKTITVHVNESAHVRDRVRLAADLAGQHDAHLIALVTRPLPAYLYVGGFDGGWAAVYGDYLAAARVRVNEALVNFEEQARHYGVTSFEQREQEDDAAASLCLQARYSDLLILGQPDPDESTPATPSSTETFVLEHAPCPVLFVPYATPGRTVGSRPVIAWDGSLEAARAIHGALPLLRAADTVQLLVFAGPGERDHGDEPGADMALHLARHGVRIEVVQRPGAAGAPAGEALLSHLIDSRADLLVMGGYGHSYFREWMLGGVTRTVLEAMTVPVLMAH